MKIVILGSLQNAPYEIIFKPILSPSGLLSAQIRCQRAIDEADAVWVVLDKMGKHTREDMAYALRTGKPIYYVGTRQRTTELNRCLDPNCANSRGHQGCKYVDITITRSGHCGLKVLKTED